MTNVLLERISICIEVLAFFVAAPDFLGEALLTAVTVKIDRVFGLWGKILDRFATRLLNAVFNFFAFPERAFGRLASYFFPKSAKKKPPTAPPANIAPAPFGRLGVILITVVAYALVWASFKFKYVLPLEDVLPAPPPDMLPQPTIPPMAVPFLVVFTIVSFAYLVQLVLEALLSIVRRSGAKGLFFIFGAVIFVCAKALAFYASGIQEIGYAEPPVRAPVSPHNTPTPADLAAQLQIVVDWTEKHAGLGGWVGALGAIVAILVAWALARAEYRRTRKQFLKRKRDEIDLIGSIVSQYDNLVQNFARAVSANESTANLFKSRHANDAEMHSMRDLAHVPVTSWPSLDAYACFKQYWHKSNQALDTSNMSPINREDAERKLKENDEGLLALRRALESALKYYK